MKTFTTKKGTELPLMNLKGKDYLQVAHRIQWFREEHPLGQIHTELVTVNDEQTIAKASVYMTFEVTDAQGNKYFSNLLVAQATKRETKKDFPDHTEKAETGAVGRALALIGYGTQFAVELDEGDRLADAPLAPAPKAAGGYPVGAASGGFKAVTPAPKKGF